MATPEERISYLEGEIEKIKLRNKKVEADKAWEISSARTAFIAIVTYIFLFAFLNFIQDSRPFINALIGTIGYLISTFSYSLLKKWWLKNRTI